MTHNHFPVEHDAEVSEVKTQEAVVTHQQVRVFQVLFPEGPDLPLSSDVPDIEFHAMRGDALYVEALKGSTKMASQTCTPLPSF